MTDIESRQAKIAALLRKAAATEFPAERAAFEKAATKLMAKWEIDERDLAEEATLTQHHMSFRDYGNFASGIATLAIKICNMNGGYAIYNEANRRKGYRKHAEILYYGTDRVRLLLEELIPFFFRQLEYEFMMSRTSSRKDFSVGFCDRVASRLKELQEVVYSESNALVPVNTKAKECMFGNVPGISKTSIQLSYRDSSYFSGTAAGDRADLGLDKITK